MTTGNETSTADGVEALEQCGHGQHSEQCDDCWEERMQTQFYTVVSAELEKRGIPSWLEPAEFGAVLVHPRPRRRQRAVRIDNN